MVISVFLQYFFDIYFFSKQITLMQILQRQDARFMHLNVLTFFTFRDIIRSQVKIHVFGFVPLKI